jgi:hypothetical protein
MPKIFTKGFKVNVIEYGDAVSVQPSIEQMVRGFFSRLQKILGL